MNRLTYIIVLAIFTSSALLAQNKNVPGYMGKRWNLQYQAYLFPSYINPNTSKVKVDDNELDRSLSVNFQSHITAGYTYSKKMEFLAEYHMSSTNFNPYSDYLYDYDTDQLYYPGLKAKGGAIGIRLYSKHFSPLGSHISFKVGFTKLDVEDLNYSYKNTNGLPQQFTISGGSKVAPTLSVGFGTNRVIKDFFVLSYGLDLSLYTGIFNSASPLSLLDDFGNYVYPSAGNSESNQEAYLQTAEQRYGLMSMVNFKLGFGILL